MENCQNIYNIEKKKQLDIKVKLLQLQKQCDFTATMGAIAYTWVNMNNIYNLYGTLLVAESI